MRFLCLAFVLWAFENSLRVNLNLSECLCSYFVDVSALIKRLAFPTMVLVFVLQDGQVAVVRSLAPPTNMVLTV